MKILFATSEAAPFVKTGGLGDVAQGLPLELSKVKDNEVCVFLPYYKSIKNNPAFNIEFVESFGMPLGWRTVHVGIFTTKIKKVTYYFLDNEYYFSRDSLYGYLDDGERFAYFSKAVLESLLHLEFSPDIIHVNDWQTALIPLFLKANYCHMEKFQKIKTVLTIHNIEYQGKASDDFLGDTMGLSEDYRGIVRFDGCVNFLKAGIVMADKITTVSKTYSYEIRHSYFAYGLHTILEEYGYKIQGIVNGIDKNVYDPRKDQNLTVKFGLTNLEKKAENKALLQERLGLSVNPDVPVVAMISRLVPHKGVELIEYVSHELVCQDLQFIILGTGERRYEDLFRSMAYLNPHKVSANIYFSNELASCIYAGSDFLLMPSKSEPCGLSQLIAMRYGTIPIVRETGGLVDTVDPVNTESFEGKGFTFKGFNAHDMLGAICRATHFYHNKEGREQVIRNIMKYDSGWKNPAAEYIDLYNSLR